MDNFSVLHISGKITKMVLKNTNNKLELFWSIKSDGKTIDMKFQNISRFKADYISAPMELQGLQILDNSKYGWETDSRFKILDYESGHISFYCESYTLNYL